MNNYELQHHGVKGMKWGVRKRYITAAQSQRNASRAANEARKNSIAESRASGDKGMGSFARANRKALNAKRQAYSQSIANDKEHNRQLRAEKKAAANTPEAKAARRKTAMKVAAAATATTLAAYGAYKVSETIKNKAAVRSYESGKRVANIYLNERGNSTTYRDIMKYTSDRTKTVSSSTTEAIKYLRNKDRRADITIKNGTKVKGYYNSIVWPRN